MYNSQTFFTIVTSWLDKFSDKQLNILLRQTDQHLASRNAAGICDLLYFEQEFKTCRECAAMKVDSNAVIER